MHENYLKNLILNLVQNDYRPAWFNKYDEITADTPYIGFGKYVSGTFYIINIVNTSYQLNKYLIDLVSIEKSLSKNLFSKVIFVSLFVGEKDNKNIETFIDNYTPQLEADFCKIFWCIDLSSSGDSFKIITGKNQPTKINNIQTLIKKTYKNKQNVNLSSKLYDLTIQSILSDPLKPKKSYFSLTLILILTYIVSFILLELSGGSIDSSTLLRYGALSNERIFIYGEYYRIFTSLFLCTGIIHLTFTIISLYVFGSRIELYLGKVHMLMLFIFSGIIANICFVYFTSDILVGASGVFGLIGASLVISKFFNKTLLGLDFITICLIAIPYILIALFIPHVSLYLNVISFIVGILISILISIDIKSNYK